MNPRNEKTIIFYLLTPGLDEILEQDEGLVDVPPVLAVIVEPLPDHLHDLGEGDHVVSQVSNLRHLGRGGAPGVIAGGLTNLDLKHRIAVI